MPDPQYDIVIGKDGQVRLEVKGSQGEQCMKLADAIRDILGQEDSREKSSEYYGPGFVRIVNKASGHVKRSP